MRFDRGYISPYFVTEQKTMKAEMENPLILIVEKKVSGLASILPVLEKVVQVGERRQGGRAAAHKRAQRAAFALLV
jgi:chaperonin GroEL